ncbi:2-oxo-4-hydroxy-4-carboxy-5-ureidoimidazoline decarboxylase [Streptomyces sp. NA04227]|uniref:2-oxo-4-hydroxy-4-carboxy-5-ureidoimidazoline decarboxylase n=1 Tax=Streptomyces sp. NA04227 TaxID=2742136 RepID=UPI0026DFA987|nr:2-oxo-4-hydroxy-4-carboxy-5-ureidoimidazoline decarboxylase [Streptomyces sp. NA04227]
MPTQTDGNRRPRGLDRFNSLTVAAAESSLLTCLSSLHWARRVASHRPYPDLDALHAAADEATYDLNPRDIAAALAREPRTAPPPRASHLTAHTALTAAHDVYEQRFGHAFVICPDDFPAEEVLDQVLHSIRSRLSNDPEEERVLAAEELRRLARGRITRLMHALGEAMDAQESPETGRPDSPYVPV